MLQIKNLTITHKKDLRTIVEEFRFTLDKGDKAALIGEEGNGKSTLLKWIHDPESISSYAQAQGECVSGGEKLGYLPQELLPEEGQKSIYDFFAQEELFWEQSPRDLNELAGELGLPGDFFYSGQSMSALSGGERVKAQMARLLISGPSILLLDEPSNDIDIKTLEWLERFILESELPILYVSHDETLIERTANVIIHLEQLRRKTLCRYTVARMPYVDYMSNRSARMENQARNARNDKRQEELKQERLRRIMQKVERDQENISRQDPSGGRLLKKKMKAMKSMEKRFGREAEEAARMPESEEAIFFKFGQEIQMPAGKVVLDLHMDALKADGDSGLWTGEGYGGGEIPARILSKNIRLVVKGAEKICIVGKNGVGKTTLLRYIARELLGRRDICAAYMPQNYEELMDMSQTPVEYLRQTGDKEETTRMRTFLGSMKYTVEEMNHAVSELSGGQKAKVLLLKMSISGANVLILDEPTRNFSPLSNPVIREVLRDYQGTIISVSHDRKYIREVCRTVYELTKEGLKLTDPL